MSFDLRLSTCDMTMGTAVSSERKALSRFQEPIFDDLLRFRRRYRTTLQSGLLVIDKVVAYLTRSHGKGLRPTLVLLSAKMGSDILSESAIRAAVVVELLHEATLIHDDVVDESPTRRGLPSLAARFKNKVSVLFGDYMLAGVLTETLDTRDLRFLDILSETAKRMSRGELVQAARSRRLDLTESDYLKMISDKTAALFNACCRMGGLTGGIDGEELKQLGVFGEKFGIAFQIRDDLLDLFGDGGLTGKPTGGDLKERKLTLPLLGALAQVSPREARRIRARIRRGVRKRDIKLIADFVESQGGREYAENVMRREAESAITAVKHLPESAIRETMIELVNYGISRRK